MSKKFKLKAKMDLIEIYQKGQWEEFISEYNLYNKEIRELDTLLDEFKGDYFLEYNIHLLGCEKAYDIITNKYEEFVNRTDDSQKMNLGVQDWFEQLDLNHQDLIKYFLGDDYKSPTNVFSDPRIARLEYLGKKWLRSNYYAIKKVNYTYLEKDIQLDKERLEFVNKYFTKSYLRVEFDNSLEEAIDYGYPEVIEFAKDLGLDSGYFYRTNLYKYLGKKLKRIRCNANMSEEDLFTELKLSSDATDSKSIKKTVRDIEKGEHYHIDLELLIKYANYFNIKLDDIIGHNSVMEELVRVQKLKENADGFIRG